MEYIFGGAFISGIFAFILLTLRTNGNIEQKVSRVYTRLDEYKDTAKKEYVKDEVCKVLRASTDEKLDRMGRDIAKIELMVRELWSNGKKG